MLDLVYEMAHFFALQLPDLCVTECYLRVNGRCAAGERAGAPSRPARGLPTLPSKGTVGSVGVACGRVESHEAHTQ